MWYCPLLLGGSRWLYITSPDLALGIVILSTDKYDEIEYSSMQDIKSDPSASVIVFSLLTCMSEPLCRYFTQ